LERALVSTTRKTSDRLQRPAFGSQRTSIRGSGVPIVHGSVSDLGSVLDTWFAAHIDGIACVIGDPTAGAACRDCS
jgi:hypothetical protein